MAMCVDNLNCLMNVSHNNLTSAVSELKITELKKTSCRFTWCGFHMRSKHWPFHGEF